MNIDVTAWEVVQELKNTRVFNLLTEDEQLEAVVHILSLCGGSCAAEDDNLKKELGEIFLKRDDIPPPHQFRLAGIYYN